MWCHLCNSSSQWCHLCNSSSQWCHLCNSSSQWCHLCNSSSQWCHLCNPSSQWCHLCNPSSQWCHLCNSSSQWCHLGNPSSQWCHLCNSSSQWCHLCNPSSQWCHLCNSSSQWCHLGNSSSQWCHLGNSSSQWCHLCKPSPVLMMHTLAYSRAVKKHKSENRIPMNIFCLPPLHTEHFCIVYNHNQWTPRNQLQTNQFYRTKQGQTMDNYCLHRTRFPDTSFHSLCFDECQDATQPDNRDKSGGCPSYPNNPSLQMKASCT